MPEKLSQLPDYRIVDTIIIIDNSSIDPQNPKLEKDTIDSTMAAGLLDTAGLIENAVLIASRNNSGNLAEENYQTFGRNKPQLEIIDPHKQTEWLIKLFKKRSEEDKSTAILTAEGANKELLSNLRKNGLTLKTRSPEEDISKRIVDSASLKTFANAFMSILRYGRIKNVHLFELKPNVS